MRLGAGAAGAGLLTYAVGPFLVIAFIVWRQGDGPDWLPITPVAVAVGLFTVAGLLLTEGLFETPGSPWFIAVAGVALLELVAMWVSSTTAFMLTYSLGFLLMWLLLAIGMLTVPELLLGRGPHRLWQATVGALLLGGAVSASLLVAANHGLGFRPEPISHAGYTVGAGTQRYQPTGAATTGLTVLAAAASVAALVLTLGALAMTIRQANALIEEVGPPAPTSSPGESFNLVAAAHLQVDPAHDERAWAAVQARPDDDPLRP